MPHPIKKIYKAGSPGAVRKERRITLSDIKKQIRGASHPSHVRASFRDLGLLGPLNANDK